MMSLTRCLKRLNLPAHEAAILRGAVKELTEDGIAAQDAALRAVREYIADAEAELQGLVDQVRAKLPQAPAEAANQAGEVDIAPPAADVPAPPPAPPTLAARRRAVIEARELERELFNALAASPDLVGKTEPELRTLVDGHLAAMADDLRAGVLQQAPERIERLAKALHRTLAAKAKRLAKQKHRDPAVLQAAIDAAGSGSLTDAGERSAFRGGFEHALAGKTKSTLAGPGLPIQMQGYEAAREWIKSEEGAAWYEGRSVNKLVNPGVDLRRHWEALREQMKAGESDAKKAWAQIERATTRADLFAPLLPEGVSPGMRTYVEQVRKHTRTFKDWLENGRTWLGSQAWQRHRKPGDETDLDFMLAGARRPDDVDRDRWTESELFRIQWLQGQAGEYLDAVRGFIGFLQGASSVKEAAERFDERYLRPAHIPFDEAAAPFKAAGISLSVTKPPYGDPAKYKLSLWGTDTAVEPATLTGDAAAMWARLMREPKPGPDGLRGPTVQLNTAAKKIVFVGRGNRTNLWSGRGWNFEGLASSSNTTQHLIENEATIALPTRADALVPPRLDRVTREGLVDSRKGASVTPKQFKEHFGFADVGFGKWVGSRQDQDHLNYAWDALNDLAKHFGMEPKNVGFGGELHFTIGALGHGKHAAHFHAGQPNPNGGMVQVINLTNTKGDGTVYHEWIHALDHNLGGEWKAATKRHGGVRGMLLEYLKAGTRTPEDVEQRARDFLFGGWYFKGDKRISKVDAAVRGVQHGLKNTSAFKSNADALGKDYWGNDFELIARASEAWSADTLGGVNTYLVNAGWVGDGKITKAAGYRGTPYPGGDERKLFNQLYTALSKAVKWKDGKPTVALADFEAAIPTEVTAWQRRRKDLSDRENMQVFYEAEVEKRARAVSEKEDEKRAVADAEQRALDELAAKKLAELQPPVVDGPPAGETQGPLTDDDLGAIFDEAAAELRESAQELPDVPPPGAQSPAADAKKEAAAQEQDANVGWWRGMTVWGRQAVLKAAGVNLPDRVLWAHVSPENRAKLLAARGAEDKLGAADLNPTTPQADPTATQLIADAAKLGVTGINEALTGLAKLFGGGDKGRLNSFGAGFDEDTYKQAKPHFKAALVAFQASGKSLKDLFKMLIQRFGDGVKEYAVRFAKDEGLTAGLGATPQVSATAKIAARVEANLSNGAPINWRMLFGWADDAFGGTQAEGKYTPKDAYDAMEAGMNRYLMAQANAFNPNGNAEQAQLALAAVQRATNLLPTQTKRTAEQDEFQQFSTVPPLAFVANWVARVGPSDTLLEPSAGIGGMAVFAHNAGAKLVLNELSSRRAAVLQEVFPAARVFHENAEQIDNVLPDGVQPTVVVMNPPFSASAGRVQGRRDTTIGGLHLTQALERLAPGGRLVAIVGEGMALDKPTFRGWWADIQKKYDVRAVVPMDGSGYAKYGTTFDNLLIVIDKRPPQARDVVTKKVQAYTDLIPLLSGIRDDRPATQLPASDREGAERDAAESARRDAAARGEGGDRSEQPDAGQPDAVGVAELLPQPDNGRDGAGGAGQRRTGRPAGRVRQPGGRPDDDGRDAGGGVGGAGEPDVGLAGRPEPEQPGAVTVQAGDAQAAAPLTDSIFETYLPQRLQIPGARPHPGALVQSAAMASVLPPPPTYTPNLPAELVTEGKLSIAQIEAVVYAGQAHEQMLEQTVGPVTAKGTKLDPEQRYRRGFFIGDGTGTGKGRMVSGVILDNQRQGRNRAVWISEKQGLMTDAKRDFDGVGGDKDLIFNQNKTDAEGAIPSKDGILFTTYSTLRSGAQSQAGGKPLTAAVLLKAFPAGTPVTVAANLRQANYEVVSFDTKRQIVLVNDLDSGREGIKTFDQVASIGGVADWRKGRPAVAGAKGGQSRFAQLVAWLGDDFDGVIVFDEAHAAGNVLEMKDARGMKSKPAAQALAVVDLQNRLPKARIVYVSATGATKTENLAYATRLGLWGAGTPFPSAEAFVSQMSVGGLATMELVARDMKQMGAYLARSLSFEGVTYSRVEHQLTETQRAIYDRLADAWQVTLQNFMAALEATGVIKEGKTKNGDALGAAKSAYWGAQQRFFNQIITSMQMPSVIDAIEADIAAGRAVVLQLVNTNEAAQDRALRERKDAGEESLEDLDLTPRDQLMQLVAKSFPVMQYQDETDADGRVRSVPALDSKGAPIINKQAERLRDALLEDLREISVPSGPLEIVLNQFGVDSVAEVTGRTQRVVQMPDEKGNLRATLEPRSALKARADADSFMADKKRILIFSDAGGTGYSFHADLTKANQRKRSHYLIQPGWRADKAVQGFGRTHRTNQASAPEYRLASTDISAQKRFLSSIARRLDQLGALTKGQRDTANQGMFSEKDNLESKYAQAAVRQLLDDAQGGAIPWLDFKGFLRELGLEDIVDRTTGQIADSKYPTTSQFLNRMLSLKLATQALVFDAFITRMEAAVELAIQRGTLDTGMQTIRALESRTVRDEVVYTDPKTQAQSRYVELALTMPTRYERPPEDYPGATPFDWKVNLKSGKVWAVKSNGKVTLKDGSIVKQFVLRGTGGSRWLNEAEYKPDAYRKITRDEGIALWQTENDARPPTYARTTHMLVGALLPIWDRVGADWQIEVARTQTVDNQRLLGLVIKPEQLGDVLKRLNVDSALSKLAASDVIARILQGEVGELANRWKLERARVSDDLRVELKARDLSMASKRELEQLGMIGERIAWIDRWFVPINKPAVLEKLLASRPLVELKKLGGDDPAFSRSAISSPETNVLRGRRAMNKAIVEKADQHRAMFRQGLGWVDFVWGDAKKGLQHVIERRASEGMQREDVIRMLTDRLVATIARGAEVRRTDVGRSTNVWIEGDGVRAVLVRNEGSNSWLLTGFELAPGERGAVFDAASPTQSTPTVTRRGLGAGAEDSVAPMARGGSAAAGMPRELIEREVGRIAAAWANAPRIAVIDSLDDPRVPAAVRAEDQRQRSQGAGGAPEGFYVGGTVYLVAPQLASAADVQRVLFHEALGHAGLRGVYGKALGDILDRVATFRRADVRAKAQQYGLDPDSASDRRIAAEEVLADLAATVPEMGLVRRVLAAIRSWLRDIGLDVRMSDDELIRNYLLPARAWVQSGGKPMESAAGVQRFSRAEAPDAWLYRFWSSRAWASEGEARAMIRRRLIEDNERYPMFAPNDPALVDGLVFVKAPKERVRLKTRPAPRRDFERVGQSVDSEGDKRPGVDWTSRDLQDDGTADSVLQAFGRGKGNVYRAWVDTSDLPLPKGGGIVGGLPDKAGDYDWREMESRGDPPPLKLRMGARGQLVLMDGNHRLAWWRAREYSEVPAYVIDERSKAADVAFSRSALDGVREWKLPAQYQLGDLLDSSGKVSWWHKSVGTMRNLAKRSPAFGRVYDAAQQYINDISYFANDAADLAPKLLPKLETWRDIGKSPISAADNAAVRAPIFEGTLAWGRDERGNAIRIADLEGRAESMTPETKAREMLRRGVITESVLKMWQGLPIDQYEASVNTRYANQVLKPGVVFTDAELRSLFRLTPGQVTLYREFRDATDRSLTNMAIGDMLRFGGQDVAPLRKRALAAGSAEKAALLLRDHLYRMAEETPDRAAVLNDTADTIVLKGDRVQGLIDRGYAPLMRFGQYTLDVVDESGERVYFGMFESARERSRMARQMRSNYPQASIAAGTTSDESYKMFAGISPETVELFGELLGLEAQGGGAANEAFQTYLKQAKATRSAMKRLIERKGIAGFSEDAGRVLAGFVVSNARQTAGNLHTGEMVEAVQAIPQGQGQLKDAAVQLVDYVRNPQEEVQQIRGLLFAQYLGGSVASAMVNALQPLQVTFPYLSQYAGIGGAALHMKNAMRDALKPQTGDKVLDAALHVAAEKGIVSPQEVHQLIGQSAGKAVLKPETSAWARGENYLSRLQLAWGKVFGVAEQFNRRTTFIAAYRIATEKGMADPAKFAEQAVVDTQFDYTKANRPRWARGAVGSLLFTFKTYSISYVELINRMWRSGPEGKKAALLALGVLVLMSGLSGLPGADDLDDVIDGLLQRLGYNFQSKAARQRFFAETLGAGELGARILEHGFSTLPGVPIDVSGRLGLGNLIPGTRLLTKKQDYGRDVAEIAGPFGDLAQRFFEGAGKLVSGDVMGAATRVAPMAAQNLIKGGQMFTTGQYKDREGRKVIDVDGYDAAVKAIGFQPADVAQVQRAARTANVMIQLNKQRESEIADAWAKGIAEKDSEAVAAARADLAEWNRDNSESPIRISMQQLRQRVHTLNMTRAERLERTASREIRQEVRRQLEPAAR